MVYNCTPNYIEESKYMHMKAKQQYIDNAELLAELLKWRDSAEDPEERIPSERLG